MILLVAKLRYAYVFKNALILLSSETSEILAVAMIEQEEICKVFFGPKYIGLVYIDHIEV